MPERWRRELGSLDELSPPPGVVSEARERLPRASEPGPSGRSRVVAGVVALGVFALAATFVWRSFEVDPAVPDRPVGPGTSDLPVLSVRFTAGALIDGDLRRVDTVIDYGDVHQEDVTSTTPENAIVEWVAVEDLTPFVPGPTVGSPVAIEADGEDPRVLIGRPAAWPAFDRFERIDRLPQVPGDYVLVFEADYPEGTARTPLRVTLVEPGTVQLVPTEGGELDAATASAFVDGTEVEGSLSQSSFARSDVVLSGPPQEPDFTGVTPLSVPSGAPALVVTEVNEATAGLTTAFRQTPKVLPLDLLAGGASLVGDPGSYLLAVDVTWAHGKLGWASEGTREEARFFFPVELIGAAPPEEPPPSASEPVEPAPIEVTSPTRGAEVTSPVSVTGTADVFEAVVTIWVMDATNNRIAEEVTMATCGTGCRGDFSVDVEYSVGQTQPGEILVFERSALDGSRSNTVRIPVTLTPGPDDPVAAEVEGQWFDAAGEPLPDLVMTVSEGPDHCGWTSATFLHLAWPIGTDTSGQEDRWRQFIRDPQGLFTERLAVPFEVGAPLPDDATPFGYTRGEWQLWIAPSDQDEAVYLVRGDPESGGVWERWPRTTAPVGCA